MEITMYVIWSVLAFAAIIIELSTQYQVGWAISIASIGGLITHAITGTNQIWIQFVVFLALWSVSWILLFIFHKKIVKKLHDKEDGFLAYIGETFKAIKGNENEYGELKINSKVFRFKCKDKIKRGDQITVKSIKGVTFDVSKKEGKK